MASIRKAKKLGIYKKPSFNKDLYQDVKMQIEKVNKRLRSLERTGNYSSYASKKLFNRLDSETIKALQKTRKGKIVKGVKLPPTGLTNTQLIAVQKATRQFLVSKTSTPRGIQNVKASVIDAIKRTMSEDDARKISDEDAQFYFDMLGESDFDYFSDKIGASTLWTLIDTAIEKNHSQNTWLKTLNNYINFENDADVREKAINLYSKYIL